MASTTIDTDTELSAVNSILGAIGQAPITQLKNPTTGTVSNANPEVQFIYNLLRDSSVDVQAEGWHFNTEEHVEYTPDATSKKIAIANDILKIDVHDGWTKRHYDVVKRSGFLYDKQRHTDVFDGVTTIELDITKLFPFEDIPPIFKRYITYRAGRQAATQLVNNPQLVQLLAQNEAQARSACMEYDCNQGNHSMFGFPEKVEYNTFQPWRNLRR